MKSNRRRKFLMQLSVLSLMTTTSCSTIAKLVMQYPDEYDTDQQKIDGNLRAFASAVLPGINTSDPNLIRAFSDPYYPFIKIRGFFIHCLCKKANKMFGKEQYYMLNDEQRTAVIKHFLNSGGRKRQLFKVSILLVQTTFYSGIYDPQNGCEFIGFGGSNYGHREEDMFYKDNNKYLAFQETSSGNYV